MSTSNYFGGRRAKRPGEGRPRRLEIRTAGRLFSKQNPSQAVSASLAAIGNNGGLANAVWRRFAAKRRSRFIDADSVRATPRRLIGAEPGRSAGIERRPPPRSHRLVVRIWTFSVGLVTPRRHPAAPGQSPAVGPPHRMGGFDRGHRSWVARPSDSSTGRKSSLGAKPLANACPSVHCHLKT